MPDWFPLTTRFRILITGSRNWSDPDTIAMAIQDYMVQVKKDLGVESFTLVHGGAPGADNMAAWAAEELHKHGWDIDIEEYPADWGKLGNAAGPARNKQMVDSGADVCLVFRRNKSRGTTNCVEQAEKAGIPRYFWETSD